jgi:hypothetical protein
LNLRQLIGSSGGKELIQVTAATALSAIKPEILLTTRRAFRTLNAGRKPRGSQSNTLLISLLSEIRKRNDH